MKWEEAVAMLKDIPESSNEIVGRRNVKFTDSVLKNELLVRI
jgi:hypothetical protein